jgi:hypothetical protein
MRRFSLACHSAIQSCKRAPETRPHCELSDWVAINQSSFGSIGSGSISPSRSGKSVDVFLPTFSYSYVDQQASARIKTFKGEKPADGINAFAARDVLRFLAPAENNERASSNSPTSNEVPRIDQPAKLEPSRSATDKAAVPQQPGIEKRTAPVRLSALLTHTKGRLISSPPMTLDAEYFDNGSGAGTSRLIIPGNRIWEGEFKMLPLQESFRGVINARLLDPDKFVPSKNSAQKGFATYSDQNGTNMECSFSLSDTGRIDQGRCLDNRGNEYRITN